MRHTRLVHTLLLATVRSHTDGAQETVETKLWNVKTMIHIVHGPIKQLYRTILSAVNTSSTGILVSKNVDVDLLYRCAAMDVVIENSRA